MKQPDDEQATTRLLWRLVLPADVRVDVSGLHQLITIDETCPDDWQVDRLGRDPWSAR